MSELKTMKSVYCYFFPEVRSLLDDVSLTLPHSMYLVTTPAEEVRRKTGILFNPPLDIPSTPQGYVDLDEIHVPVIERIVKMHSSLVPGLKNFKNSYPTPGSSEGIFKLLAKAKAEGVESIYVLDGEYEGYGEYAGPQDLGMRVDVIDPQRSDPRKLKPGLWFVSNPSARDGNIIPNEFINGLCDAGHKVVVDLSYVGATKPYQFDVSHENIPAVLMSLSKPYGLFRFRIGFTFSREPMHSLYGNKWFKDPERLLQGLKVVEELGPHGNHSTRLYEKYRPVQGKIVDNINRECGLRMRSSDSMLLGHMPGEDASRMGKSANDLIKPFSRGSGYRFCLTPYFEEWERRRL